MRIKSSNMENHIYSIPGSRNYGFEGGAKVEEDFEQKFVSKTAEIVCECLGISYADKRITKVLLENALTLSLNNRDDRDPGLLQQYLAHELEAIAVPMKGVLKIPQYLKINHSYSTDSKFGSIISYIAQNFVRIDDIKSDGTFERIFSGNECECESECESDERCLTGEDPKEDPTFTMLSKT